jgi:hypothetical protein
MLLPLDSHCYPSPPRMFQPAHNSNKVKIKVILEQATTTQREKYSHTLYLTSALDGVHCQRHAPAALPTGKTGIHFTGRSG